jgi:hypothetical protein
MLRFLVNLFGIGLPVCILLEPVINTVINNYRRRLREEANNRFIQGLMGRHFGTQNQTAYQNPLRGEPVADNQYQPAEVKPPASNQEQYHSLLTSAQIEQLNTMRSQITLLEARQFPLIRLSGQDMPNLVPGAGIFTAKIKRHGEIQNLVVMLSSMAAVSELEKLCYSYGTLPKDFWAEGYLLPSRTGICYSVLLVTAFRICGRKLIF